MSKFRLTGLELKELQVAELSINQPQLLKRIQSLKMRDKGITNLIIGEVLCKSDQTISGWVQLYRKEGLQGLMRWNYSGKVSILSKENLAQLEKRNAEQPFEKASEAKAYIEEEFGIIFHLHWVQKIMKKNFALHTKKQD